MRLVLVIALLATACADDPAPISKAQLGNLVFHDPKLSDPPGQACADCHDDRIAFSDPEDERTSAGAISDRLGSRNAQTAMYARFAPPLHRDANGRMIGGLFWDGRANTLEDQAAGPLLNPLEMNNPSKAHVVAHVRPSTYARAFRDQFGADALDDDDRAFARIAEVIAAYERSETFAPFSSKYDRYLTGTATLDEREARGLAIFEDPDRGNCASCHPSRPATDGTPPLFTDFSYANIGLPAFVDNPFYRLPRELNPDGENFIDHGLAKTTGDPAHDGQFRVPTLRNVARTMPYGHNGYFRRLDEAVAFHGGHALDSKDIADLVAFLGALSDSPH